MHNPKKMAPLWGRDNPTTDGWFVQTHDVKTALDGSNPSMILAADFVNTRSGMCLSCHDGITPIVANITVQGAVGASPNFGRDLSNMHNVGRVRNSTNYDGTPVDPNILNNNDIVGEGATAKYYIGCGSCHSMHNSQGNQKLLRKAANGSVTVCLNCHSTK
jgi:predicted CXXCH cytochrome family protein